MKKTKGFCLEPVGDEIYLEMEEAKLGNLDSSSVKTGMEWGIITAVGPDVKNQSLKIGTKVFCKGWAMDVILYEGKNYIFTSESRHGIKAILR